jgi:hypothetical protein
VGHQSAECQEEVATRLSRVERALGLVPPSQFFANYRTVRFPSVFKQFLAGLLAKMLQAYLCNSPFFKFGPPRVDLNSLTASGEVDRLDERPSNQTDEKQYSEFSTCLIRRTPKPHSIASRVFPRPPCPLGRMPSRVRCDASSSAGHARARPTQRGRAPPPILPFARGASSGPVGLRPDFRRIGRPGVGGGRRAGARPADFPDAMSKNVTFMQQVVRKCRTVAIFVSFSVSDVGRLAYGSPRERELPGRESDGGVQQPGGTSSQTPQSG